MRDEKTRRRRFSGRKAQAARRRQLHLFDNADDDGKALSPQALFDGIQRVARTRRLNDQEARRIKTETRKARRRRRAEFACQLPRPAPEHPGQSGSIRPLRRREGIDPADRQTRRKTDPRHPIRRRSAANGRRLTLDFMEGVRLQPSRQEIVAHRTAKLPRDPPPPRPGQ